MDTQATLLQLADTSHRHLQSNANIFYRVAYI